MLKLARQNGLGRICLVSGNEGCVHFSIFLYHMQRIYIVQHIFRDAGLRAGLYGWILVFIWSVWTVEATFVRDLFGRFSLLCGSDEFTMASNHT